MASAVTSDPEIIGGAAVFADFLADFPSVGRGQIVAFLEEAKDRLVEALP